MREWIDQLADDCDYDLTVMDGFDDCIVGIVERCTMPPIVCYDREKVIAALMRDGMTWEEAEEYFEFNQMGAWVGDSTPCFLIKDPDASDA
jgi:hypothetical protein